jgi:methanogenic corrinoid protein MtbC1
VYKDKEEKLRLFESYENAKESLIQLLYRGLSMVEIMDICQSHMERRCG